jgi:hypothetical protein
MAGAWVDGVALKASLRGTALASALAYAEGQGWIADGVKKGWMTVTRLGERAARLYVVGMQTSRVTGRDRYRVTHHDLIALAERRRNGLHNGLSRPDRHRN